MTKIKNVEEKLKDNGKKSWKFTLEDGVVGYITNDKPWEWKAEEEVTYTKQEKKTPNGSYNLLTLTRVASTPPTQSSQPPSQQKQELKEGEILLPSTKGFEHAKTLQEMRFESRVHCLKLAVKCYLGRGIEYDKVGTYFNEWVALMDTAIDELKPK